MPFLLEEDFTQAHDLAKEYPDQLDKMVKLFFAEASKYNVLPLEALGGEKTDFTFYQGLSPLHQDLAPNTFATSYTIDVYLDRKEADSSGVLVAQGGTGGGYTLYIDEDNKLVYEYSYLGFERYTINTDTRIPIGKSKITYKFTNTGANYDEGYYMGTGEIFLDDVSMSTMEIPKTVPSSFGVEFFDVGQDSQSPVSEAYKPPFTFNDTIEKVTVKIETDESST